MSSFLRLWLIALFVKAVLAVLLPFSSDEAYYWVWGHHLQLSYFDHPPMVAWLFGIGSWFDFFGQASRLPAVALGHFTLLIWNRLLEPYLDESKRVGWLGFVLLSPFLGFGSLIVTPDLPLVFFWSLGILTLLRALERRTLGAYTILGAVLGLGFCAKYHMVLFVPTAFGWLFASGRWRDVRWPYVALTVASGLIACAPVWGWNAANDWVSFRFQLDHGLKGAKWNWGVPALYVLGQVGLIFPTVLVLALRRCEPKGARWLHAFAWFPLLFFLYTSFKARVEANWPVIAYPAVLSLAYLNAGRADRWIKSTMLIWFAANSLVLSEAAFGWLPVDRNRLKTTEFSKFDPLIEVSREAQPFYAGSYQMASALSYKTRRMIYKLQFMNRRDFYDFQPLAKPSSEVFYVASEGGHPLPQWLGEEGYEAKLWRQVTPQFQVFEVRRRAQNTGP